MQIPASQFYVFCLDNSILYQTFEEALEESCRRAKSMEFIDLDPEEKYDICLYFPATQRKITIHRKLFTYNPSLPLATLDYTKTKNKCEYKKLEL